MELFYALRSNIDLMGKRLILDGDEFHHLVRVLRKKTGDRIHVTDGCGLHLDVLVAAIGKHALEGDILSERTEPYPRTKVTVALSLLKAPQRFEFFLEKATELGISGIIPMITFRTVSQPKEERTAKKLLRWRNIVLSAARQSRRYYLPHISEPLSFAAVTALEGFESRLIPYELSSQPLSDRIFSGGNVLFLIGGEGGFSTEEVREAKAAGFAEISFGRSTLRAETAAIFAVSLVRARLLEQAEEEWF